MTRKKHRFQGNKKKYKNMNEEELSQKIDDNQRQTVKDAENIDAMVSEILDNADADETKISQLTAQLNEATSALEKEKKEYMFLLADFDNFRKRVSREKVELIKNGAEKALAALLPIVDDFERGLDAAEKTENAESILTGMKLIYQKLIKYLADNGVQAIPTEPGSDFDTDKHEAIATIPAPSPELKGKIIDTTQRGYTLNSDKILRHAKVVVGE